jgi:hypothetical protein
LSDAITTKNLTKWTKKNLTKTESLNKYGTVQYRYRYVFPGYFTVNNTRIYDEWSQLVPVSIQIPGTYMKIIFRNHKSGAPQSSCKQIEKFAGSRIIIYPEYTDIHFYVLVGGLGTYLRDVHRYLRYGRQLYGGRKGKAALMGQEAGCYIAAQLLQCCPLHDNK